MVAVQDQSNFLFSTQVRDSSYKSKLLGRLSSTRLSCYVQRASMLSFALLSDTLFAVADTPLHFCLLQSARQTGNVRFCFLFTQAIHLVYYFPTFIANVLVFLFTRSHLLGVMFITR